MTGFPRGKVVFLVTGNIHKFNEARLVLREYKIATAMVKRVSAIEIQDDSIEEIAKASAADAVEKCNLPIVVEDAGLFIEALNGFPGPYSSYIYRTIGNKGILRLMKNVTNRNACFKSVAAFLDPSMDRPLSFKGDVKGEILKKERGNQGFGFDPLFKPLDWSIAFAEMAVDVKNKFSHRASAFRKFAEWYAVRS